MGNEGYISSYVTQQIGCGNTDQPWLLQAAAGQMINLTLIDFTMNQYPSQEIETNQCLVYATIKEGNGAVTHTVCGGRGQKVVPVFLSISNTVEIRIISKSKQVNNYQGQFLLMYRGNFSSIHLEFQI